MVMFACFVQPTVHNPKTVSYCFTDCFLIIEFQRIYRPLTVHICQTLQFKLQEYGVFVVPYTPKSCLKQLFHELVEYSVLQMMAVIADILLNLVSVFRNIKRLRLHLYKAP